MHFIWPGWVTWTLVCRYAVCQHGFGSSGVCLMPDGTHNIPTTGPKKAVGFLQFPFPTLDIFLQSSRQRGAALPLSLIHRLTEIYLSLRRREATSPERHRTFEYFLKSQSARPTSTISAGVEPEFTSFTIAGVMRHVWT